MDATNSIQEQDSSALMPPVEYKQQLRVPELTKRESMLTVRSTVTIQSTPTKKERPLAFKIFGICYLACCVIGGSLIGPVSNLVAPTTTGLKNTWRAAILIIYFTIPTLVEMRYNDWSKYAPFFNLSSYGKFLLLIFF